MSVNYFDNDKPENIVERAVEEVEYRLVGGKMAKLSDPRGGTVIESKSNGDVKETDIHARDLATYQGDKVAGYMVISSASQRQLVETGLKLESLLETQRRLGSGINMLKRLMHADLGFVRKADFADEATAWFFPINLVVAKTCK